MVVARVVASIRSTLQERTQEVMTESYSFSPASRAKISTRVAKRAFDVLLSGTGLLLSLPAWIAFAVAIRLEDGGPVLFRQGRLGRGGRPFTMLKFRSMVPDAEVGTGPVWATEDDPRVTRVGRFLRNTGMDELPQLVNIFLGQMSFVGPRPERPEFVEKFLSSSSEYPLRFSVRPGLTGLAQVYGRYDSDPREKLLFDLLYVRNHNFRLDLRVVILSFGITFRGKWESREQKVKKLLAIVRAEASPDSAMQLPHTEASEDAPS